MKHFYLSLILTNFLSMVGHNAYAAFVEESVRIDSLYYCFDYENSIAKVVRKPTTWNSSSNYSWKSIEIPSEVEYNGKRFSVTMIFGAFYHCTSLVSVKIPNSVTVIGVSAFAQCRSLKSINLPNNLTEIGNGAFGECGITSIEIPNTVTTIGVEAFYNSAISSIKIPRSITKIGLRCFGDCGNLKSVILHDNITSIEECAFEGCYNLPSINIPNSVNYIGPRAFSRCGLKSVKIPNSLTTIEESTFYKCYHLTFVDIPNSVTTIGNAAFLGCSALPFISIPNSVTKIEELAFWECQCLKTVFIDIETPLEIGRTFYNPEYATLYVPMGSKAAYEATDRWNDFKTIVDNEFEIDGIWYRFNEDYTATVLTPRINTKYSGNISIPSSLFYNDHNYTVTSIENTAFKECTNLTSIDIPNSVTSIGEEAFYGCSQITSVEIPNSVTAIGASAFERCGNLVSVNIPNSLNSLGRNIFAGCSKLTYIAIPNSVTTIGYGTFGGCSSLISVVIPNSVTKIGDYAFYNCKNLASITIPKSITSIGNYAFRECKILTSVKVDNISPLSIHISNVSSHPFEDNVNATLYVPLGCKARYEAASGWNRFKKIVEKTIHNLTYLVDDEEYRLYALVEGESIVLEAEPIKEGYTFSGWSEIPESMPDHDVTIAGTFAINNYNLTYMVDGEVYKTYNVEYGAKITPETEPTKEGYTFSGWSEIPESMPAHDVTVTGTFTLDTGIDQIMGSENGKAMIFTIDGKRVDTPKKGMNIIRMKDGTTRKVVVK